MKSFTVYEHKNTDAFRVVAGEHAPTHEVNGYKVRVYQGKDTITAAQTAYAAETRGDIRGQIARFIPESLSGGNPGEKLVRLPANHRGVVEGEELRGASDREARRALPEARPLSRSPSSVRSNCVRS